jgi:hypothetical protein
MKENWEWCNLGGKYCGAKFLMWMGSGQLCYGDISPERTSTCDPTYKSVEDQKILEEIRTEITQHFEEKKTKCDITEDN